MKRSLLLFALLAPVPLAAQEPQPRNGPKIGMTMASQTSGGFLSWSGLPKLGPMVGWSFEVPVTNQVSMLFEPMYISKGYWYYNGAVQLTQRATFGYIEMPVMVKISTNPDPQGLFLTGGFAYGYWIYDHVYQASYGQVQTDASFAPSSGQSQWSVGLGIGHEIKNWMWEIRGQNSFRLFYPFIYAHNVVFTGSVCWRFPLEKKKKKHKGDDDDNNDDK